MTLCSTYNIESFISPRYVQGQQRYKGSQPITFTHNHVDMLKRNNDKYSVNTKTDGERFFLHIDKDGNVHKYPKKLVMEKIKTRGMKDAKLGNTLIDGEVIETSKNKELFIAFDVMFYKNVCLLDKNYKERFKLLSRIVKELKPYMTEFKIQLQDTIHENNAFKYGQGMLSIKKKYNTDGLIFYPNTPYIIGVNTDTQLPLLKWKPFIQNTVDNQ